MRVRRASLAVTMAGCAALWAAPARAVDGAIEINQAGALAGGVTPGDSAGFPVTLSVSGHYVLTADLTVPNQNTNGIELTAGPAQLDLNGFSIRGPVTCPGSVPACSPVGSGYGVYSNQNAIRIRNGVIRGSGSSGVSVGAAARLEDLRLEQNGTGGARVTAAALVSGCTITNNGGPGVTVGYGSRVADNVIFRNMSVGISFNSGTSGYAGNTIRENNGADTNAQVSSNGLQLGANQCGADLTCP